MDRALLMVGVLLGALIVAIFEGTAIGILAILPVLGLSWGLMILLLDRDSP